MTLIWQFSGVGTLSLEDEEVSAVLCVFYPVDRTFIIECQIYAVAQAPPIIRAGLAPPTMVPVPLPTVHPHLRLHDREVSARALPSEILAHVFSFGSRSYDHERRAATDIQDSTTFPVLASHVCRYWRRIALSNARLWRTILLTFHDLDNIYDPMTSSQSCTHSCPKLSLLWRKRAETFLTRSRSHPIHLHLDLRDPLWDFQRQDSSHGFHWLLMQPVLDVLLPHASRWQHVSLISDTYEPIYAFMNRCQAHSAPMLRSIELSRCNAYFVMPGEIFTPPILGSGLPLFESIPSLLQHIELAGAHLDWDILADSSSSSTLTSLQTLELKYHAQNVLPSVFTFTTLLSNNSQLRKICISGWVVQSIASSDVSEFASSIKLPELQEFEFGWVDGEYASRVLQLFDWSVCGAKLKSLRLEDVKSGLDPMGVWMYDEADPQTYANHDGYELRVGSDAVFSVFATAEIRSVFQNVESVTLRNIICSQDRLQVFLNAMTRTRRVELDGMELESIIAILGSVGESLHENGGNLTNEVRDT